MQLLPQGIAATLPPLYATEETPILDKMVYAKFFDPYSQWVWYVCEYDPNECLFFGYVIGQEKELGYFSLAELKSLKWPDGAPRIERDVNFVPTIFKDLNI
jgi:hypothetical protein